MMSVGDIMRHQGMFSTPGFPYRFNGFLNDFPHTNHGIPLVYA